MRYSVTATAIAALLVLQTVMLFAMFTQAPPHPPYVVAPFGMGPFLGVSLAVCVAALMRMPGRSGAILALLAGALAMVSYGPQKWFDAAFGEVWPAVIAAQLATLFIVIDVVKDMRGTRQGA